MEEVNTYRIDAEKGQDLERLAEQEEEYFVDAILPILTEKVEPLMKKFNRDFSFRLNYNASGSLSVSVAHKCDTGDLDLDEGVLYYNTFESTSNVTNVFPEVQEETPEVVEESTVPNNEKKKVKKDNIFKAIDVPRDEAIDSIEEWNASANGTGYRLKVNYRDGKSKVWSNANNLFFECLKSMAPFDLIEQLDIYIADINLVSEKSETYSKYQRNLANGKCLMTLCPLKRKVEILEYISSVFECGISAEIVEPDDASVKAVEPDYGYKVTNTSQIDKLNTKPKPKEPWINWYIPGLHHVNIRVTLPSGKRIMNANNVATFVEAINLLEPEVVRHLGIQFLGDNIITKTVNPKSEWAYKTAKDGWYIVSNQSIEMKYQILGYISKQLELGWKVDIVDKHSRTVYSVREQKPLLIVPVKD